MPRRRAPRGAPRRDPPPRWPQRTDAEERALRARLAALPATDAPCPYVRYRAPGCSVDSPALAVHAARLARTFEEVRVAGFSASGASLVIGEPHTLHLFHRA